MRYQVEYSIYVDAERVKVGTCEVEADDQIDASYEAKRWVWDHTDVHADNRLWHIEVNTIDELPEAPASHVYMVTFESVPAVPLYFGCEYFTDKMKAANFLARQTNKGYRCRAYECTEITL